MAVSAEYKEFLAELLSGLGPVSIRSMFGGAGIYADDVMFALIADETLYFKVAEQNKSDYEAEGMHPFKYAGKGKTIEMSYWEVPERLYDDPQEIAVWARKSLDIALRNASAKKKKKSEKS